MITIAENNPHNNLRSPPPPAPRPFPPTTKRILIINDPGLAAYDKGKRLEAAPRDELDAVLPLPTLSAGQAEQLAALRASLMEADGALAVLEKRKLEIQEKLPRLIGEERDLSAGDPDQADELLHTRAAVELSRNWLATTCPRRRADLLANIRNTRSTLRALFLDLFPGSAAVSPTWSPPAWLDIRQDIPVAALVAAADNLLTLPKAEV